MTSFLRSVKAARVSQDMEVKWGVTSTRARRLTRRVAALVVISSPLVPSVSGASGSPQTTVGTFDAPYLGSPPPSGSPVVDVIAASSEVGYYVLRADGEVDAYGATSYGSLHSSSLPLGVSATGITLDAATGGYWIVCSNGRVEGFNAPYLGKPHIPSGGWGQFPAAVAITASTNGSGYYVLRANGEVNTFGVTGHGSLKGHLHYGATAPVVAVALAIDPATGGYWIATSSGSVANFDAPALGSPLESAHGTYDNVATSGLVATSSGTGYYVLAANGTIDAFGVTSGTASPTTLPLPTGGSASAIALDPSTGGYYVGVDATSVGGYRNPLRALTSLVPQEVDEGVDYCASGPIYALGTGVVANVYDAQWPSGVFISYRLTAGPATGHFVYVAENVTPSVHVGELVNATTVMGIVHDAKTCLETGWADPPSSPEHAAAHLEYNGKNSTAYGLNFDSLLQALGARPGLPQPDGPPGPLPESWPTW